MISIFSVAHISIAKSEKKVQVTKQKYEEAQSNANKALKAMMELGLETYEGDIVPIENLEREDVHETSEAEQHSAQ